MKTDNTLRNIQGLQNKREIIIEDLEELKLNVIILVRYK